MAKQRTKNQIPTHDNAYKNIFSHPEMVKALLTGFVDAEIVRHFDLNTLQKQSGNYVTDDLRDRESDIIWRVRFKENWIYICEPAILNSYFMCDDNRLLIELH